MKRREFIFKIAITAGILIFILLIVYTNLCHYNYKMNADIGSEAVLGELIWESKQLLPDTWYPSTEARVISTPNVAALFYGITGNMNLSMGLACCFMTVLIVCGILFFCKRVEWIGIPCILMVFLSLTMPTDFTFLELVYVFAGYYAIQTAVLFFTLGIYVEALKGGKIKYGWFIAGLAASLLLGFQGMRGILVLYGPLFGIEAMRRIYFLYNGQKKSCGWSVSLWVLLLLTASFIGSCFPFSASQNLSRNFRKGMAKLFTVVIPDMGKILGFESANTVSRVCMSAFVLLALYTTFEILLRLFRKGKAEPAEWAYLMVVSSPFVTAFIVAFTTVESTPRYYFMLIYAMAFSAVLLFGKSHLLSGFIGMAVLVLALTNMVQVYLPVLKSKEPPLTEACQVVRYLEESGVTIAYADFENANAMTALSNGAVRVAPVASIAKMDICKWLSSSAWYPPNQPYECIVAYIITETQEEEMKQFLTGKTETIREAEAFGKYIVYTSNFNYANLGEEQE